MTDLPSTESLAAQILCVRAIIMLVTPESWRHTSKGVPSEHLSVARSSFSKIVGHCLAPAQPRIEAVAINVIKSFLITFRQLARFAPTRLLIEAPTRQHGRPKGRGRRVSRRRN